MTHSTRFTAAVAALLLGASFVSAEEPVDAPAAKAAAQSRVLTFGEGAARLHVTRDTASGRMTFRLADPSVRLDSAPVITTTTSEGPRDVTLTAVEGQPGVWTWTSDSVKADRFDGSMRIALGGRTYTSSLATVWTTESTLPEPPMVPASPPSEIPMESPSRIPAAPPAQVPTAQPTGRGSPCPKMGRAPSAPSPARGPYAQPGVAPAPNMPAAPSAAKARNGGRLLALTDCGTSVEIVQDAAAGTLTIYSPDGVVIDEAPVITITESAEPTTVTLTRVDGQSGAWSATHASFHRTAVAASLRLAVNGKTCEAPLALGPAASHGGRIVAVEGGPSFEVVHDPAAGHWTFYAVEETVDGKPYTIERPTVVVSGRTYELTPVSGEPRAWRLVGLDTAGSDARDAQLNLTLFGKTLSTRLGLSGVDVDAHP